ncbi:MAG: 6-bladed beta-propeller, partial [Gemmatimonadetes bacterium]|nr:6-bladed beta-propeller [Gemmatimonadota bacterium]
MRSRRSRRERFPPSGGRSSRPTIRPEIRFGLAPYRSGGNGGGLAAGWEMKVQGHRGADRRRDGAEHGGRMGRFQIIGVASWLGVLVYGHGVVAQELAELPSEDRRLEAGFEEVFRVGGIDGDIWEQFGRIQDVAFDGAGNLYLLDIVALTVVVVDREGSFVRTIGRAGDGPGEFASPKWLAVLEDGRIVVSDVPRHRAFQIYNSDGSFDRCVRVGNDLLSVADRIHAGREGV